MKKIDKQLLLDNLISLAQEHEYITSSIVADSSKLGIGYSLTAYLNTFSSIKEACELAGVPYYNPAQKISEDALIESLIRYYNEHGMPPRSRDCQKTDYLYGSNTYSRRFGSFYAALEAAGISIMQHTKISDRELLDKLVDFYTKYSRSPFVTDLTSEYDMPCASTYINRFGSIDTAIELAGLPLNNSKVSKIELELVDHLSQYFDVRTQIKLSNKKEVDIIVNNVLAIEINGAYWHSEAKGKDKFYHINKTSQVHKELGIPLVHITDVEWYSNKSLVLSRIKAKLGLYSQKLYARKCSVEPITVDLEREFLDTNHIQGYSPSKIAIGLFDTRRELVAVMSFAAARYTTNAQWELLRLATKQNTIVIGGASKLFKYFVRKYNPDSIVSYSSITWNIGDIYSTLGFIYAHSSDPGYNYYKSGKKYSRIKFQKHKLNELFPEYFDPKLTEYEIMQKAGYDRVWDCGNKVFYWNRAIV